MDGGDGDVEYGILRVILILADEVRLMYILLHSLLFDDFSIFPINVLCSVRKAHQYSVKSQKTIMEVDDFCHLWKVWDHGLERNSPNHMIVQHDDLPGTLVHNIGFPVTSEHKRLTTQTRQ